MLRLLIPGLMGLMLLAGCSAKTESESKGEADSPKAELGEVTTKDPGASMLNDMENDTPSSNDNDGNTDPAPTEPIPEASANDNASDTDDQPKKAASDAEPFIEIDKDEEDE